MQKLRTAMLMAVLGVMGGPTTSPAQVEFTDWQETPFDDIVWAAGRAHQLVLLVITQPDWCPPCIRLERDFLANPKAIELHELTKNWVALEVLGYTPGGAALLMREGIRFVGTPTTYLYAPTPGTARLGEGKLLTSIVGYADDYVARLKAAAEGHDAVAEARAKAESTDRPGAWMELGGLYVGRGDAEKARDCFQRVVANKAYALPGIGPDSLNTLRRIARWTLAAEVTQRLEKDHERALVELERYAEDFPDQATSDDYVYAHAWSLASVGKADQALAELERKFLQAGTADGLLTFLYFAFRIPNPLLLQRAEAEAQAGLERFPDREAALRAALGRIFRRLGRPADAEAAFARAVELTPETDPSYPVYLAQRDFVRTHPEGR